MLLACLFLLLITTHHVINPWPLLLAKHATLCIEAPSQHSDTVLLEAMCHAVQLQRWDTPKREIENGVYLGHIASISFLGPWALQSVRTSLLSVFLQTRFVLGSDILNCTKRH